MEPEITNGVCLPSSQTSALESPSKLTVLVRTKAAPSLSQQEIGEKAYQKWEAAGKPAGKDLKFWLEAQHELSRMKQRLTKEF
jgi:hypothetical protein